MRSLEQLLTREKRFVGAAEKATFYPKKIQTPSGTERFVAGHTSDFIEPGDRTGQRFNHELLTSTNWNHNRFQTKVRKKFDVTFDAIPMEADREDTIKDTT